MRGQDKQSITLCSQVLVRFGLAHKILDKLLLVYGEAAAVPGHLTACLEGARVVRDELEAVGSLDADFGQWYAPHREAFASDPLMRWAFDARDKSVHQRDLAEHSRIKVELFASYRLEPLATWQPGSVFASGTEIVNSVPDQHLNAHVREHGVLRISRRWVDDELPDWEIVGALDTVYNRLLEMIAGLYRHCGVSFPAPEVHADVLAPDEWRRVYLGVKDGLYLAHSERRPSEREMGEKTTFGGSALPAISEQATGFRDIGQLVFAHAAASLQARRFHPMILFLSGTNLLTVRELSFEHRAHKYAVFHELAELAREIEADGVLLLVEGWYAGAAALGPGQVPDKKSAAGEALMLQGADATGRVLQLLSVIRRGLIRRSRVKALGPLVEEKRSIPGTVVPFLELWGKLDALNLPAEADFTRDVVFLD